MVFVRETLVSEVRQLGAALVNLGYGGYTANKGAVAVRLNLSIRRCACMCALGCWPIEHCV